MNKAIFALIVCAIIIVSLSSIALFSYNNDNIKNEKLNDDIQLTEKLTSAQNQLSENYQNAQMLVNIVIKNYDKNDQEIESLENMLGFNIDTGNEKYVFVYDMGTKNIVAHPNPDLIGQNVFEDLITVIDPVSQIHSELSSDGESIMRYQWMNPDTLKEEIKTSYLKLHDGLVFGSGYFE